MGLRWAGLKELSIPIVAAASCLVMGTGHALASAGCDAVNGGAFNYTGPLLSLSLGGFAEGDKITATVGTSNGVHYLIQSGATFLISFSHPFDGDVASVTLAAGQTTLDFSASNHGGASSVTATCVSSVVANTDSAKARAMQIAGSQFAARVSGQAIGDATTSAIADQLTDTPTETGSAPLPAASGLGGPTEGAPLSRDSMSRLGARQEDQGSNVHARMGQGSAVRVWTDVRGTGIIGRDDRINGFQGDQINVTSGVGVRIMPGVVIGALGGYENFDYRNRGLDGELKGDGLTGGLYLGAKLRDNLRLDVMGALSSMSYDVRGGAAIGEFDADRRIFSGTLTGRVPAMSPTSYFDPSIGILWLSESQKAWTDTLGVTHSSRDFDEGRLSIGSKFGTTLIVPGATLNPYIGGYADYYFGDKAGMPTGLEGLGLNDGWSFRSVAGVSAMIGRHTLQLGGVIGGIGDDYRTLSLRAGYSTRF